MKCICTTQKQLLSQPPRAPMCPEKVQLIIFALRGLMQDPRVGAWLSSDLKPQFLVTVFNIRVLCTQCLIILVIVVVQNKSYSTTLVDPKIVYEPYPLGPQKVKNNPKIKSKLNVRFEGNKEHLNLIPTLKIAQYGLIRQQIEMNLKQ